MILVSILLSLLAQDVKTPAPPTALAAAQAGASAAHRLFREKSRGPQQCDPQTATASSAANRLAIEATQRRQEALSALDKVGQTDSGAIPADPIDSELGPATDLLRRDMASSVAMLAMATPGEVMETPALHLILERAGSLPSVEAMKNAVSGQSPSGVQLPPALARDLASEESLINAYFAATRVELDRVCLEKPVAGNDPFRVPARPAKPAAKSKKGIRR